MLRRKGCCHQVNTNLPVSLLENCRTDDGGQRAVNVSWTPGFDGNSPIKQYIVQKREVPEFGK